MSKARILMTISHYRGFGGHDIVINNLCSGLQKIGYDVTIGAFSFDQTPPNEIKKIKLKKTNFLKESNDFDLIHNHETFMNYYCIFNKKPIVFHYHGANGIAQKINLRTCLFILQNRISKIISVSNSATDHLKNISNIPSTVIYNGVDTDFYESNLPKVHTKGSPQLLFVGSLLPHKNIETIIDAMKLITEIYPSAHLQIVGSGKNYAHLKNLIKKKNLENNVELVGKLNKEELKLRYSSCDVYISASTLETFDMPVLEAMSCGKPSILSDIPAHEELLDASKAGLTFSSFDIYEIREQLKKVFEQNQFFGSNARKFAERYDWSIICKQVGHIYDEILQ